MFCIVETIYRDEFSSSDDSDSSSEELDPLENYLREQKILDLKKKGRFQNSEVRNVQFQEPPMVNSGNPSFKQSHGRGSPKLSIPENGPVTDGYIM